MLMPLYTVCPSSSLRGRTQHMLPVQPSSVSLQKGQRGASWIWQSRTPRQQEPSLSNRGEKPLSGHIIVDDLSYLARRGRFILPRGNLRRDTVLLDVQSAIF